MLRADGDPRAFLDPGRPGHRRKRSSADAAKVGLSRAGANVVLMYAKLGH